jgi:hypothetical protein
METSSIATSPSRSSTDWTIVGDPEDLRVRLFSAALAERRVRPTIVDYRALLAGGEAPARGIVRLESPGRALDLHLALVARGGGARGATAPEPERILSPSRWYRGFADLLATVKDALSDGAVLYTSHPDDIALLFDKRACHARLQGAGVPVAPALPPPASFEELRRATDSAGWSRVFVKLRHGSAASGVVAYERSRRGEQAYTTVELVDGGGETRLYNTRRLRRLRSGAEIAKVVDELCREGVHVERWIPKAGLDGATADLRVLVVAGRPAHAVVRMAKGPITNLHLGGQRTDASRLRSRMPEAAWRSLLDTCARVGGLFPRSLHVALDVAVTPDFRSHFVLEANAFGDLLKEVRHLGRSTYELELDAVAAGWAPS